MERAASIAIMTFMERSPGVFRSACSAARTTLAPVKLLPWMAYINSEVSPLKPPAHEAVWPFKSAPVKEAGGPSKETMPN